MRRYKKLHLALSLSVVMIVCCLMAVVLSSCNLEKVQEISVSGPEGALCIGEFNYSAYEVEVKYESGKTETVKLDESMISAADKMKVYQEGEHEITVE